MMVESALYVLAGLALYGGAHQLYLGARRTPDHTHVIHAVMYLLLCAFAVTCALGYQAPSVAALIATGKASVSAGLLLWGVLAWFVAAYSGFRPRLLLAALSVVWSLLLIGNIGAPFSLFYSDVTPLNQTLPSGQVQLGLHTRPSPWWTVVQIAMLGSLLFSLYASFRLYRCDEKRAALALGSGLLVLLGASVSDSLVSAGQLQSAFLAPFGFLALLVATSACPGLRAARRVSRVDEPPTSYNMTFHLNQPPRPRSPAFAQAPLQEAPGVDIGRPTQAEITHDDRPSRFVFSSPETPDRVARNTGSTATDEVTEAVVGEANTEQDRQPTEPPPAATTGPRLDESALAEVSDNLIDIAVCATMAMNRFKRGGADPETMEALFRKVRAQAISTRRIASRMLHPGSASSDRDDDAADPSSSE
jgi:hypothetical protein